MAKTKLEEVRDYMEQLKETMAETLDKADTLQKEAEKDLRKASDEMEQAAAALDTAAFHKAADRKKRAAESVEMFNKRRGQIVKKGYLPERESDAIIDKLLDYEKELATQYRADITSHIIALRDLSSKYSAEVRSVEDTLERWQYEIHPNYLDRGNNRREEHPVKVHFLRYDGSEELESTAAYLRKTPIEKIVKEAKTK